MSKNLYRSIAVSFLLMLSITALSSTAFAQATTDEESEDYEDDEELEEVVITGSVLRRIDDSVSPVTVMSDGWLEERGINTVSEALQRLPANNAGTITNNWNVGFNFATGATAPALRGLTVQSTLSIADGLRVAPYPLADDGQRNFVDLNTFPNATIERIEVLRDGASSTYGADAIAGVVNVITKKEIQGLHTNASLGFSQHGGGDEQRVDFAWGNGDLDSDGHNFYIAGEYMKMDTLYARDRWSPWNSGDWTSVCGSSGSCLTNHNWNGITPEDGSFNGFISVPGVTFVRPVLTDTATSGSGRFQYLNSSAGCRNWPTVNVDPAVSGTSPSVNCEVDIINNYQEFQPEIERKGLALRYTANIGDSTQFYASANYYITQTFTAFTPLGFNGTPPPPRPSTVTPYNVLLPVYVCSTGVGTQSGLGTGCTAANGTLNPNNPFAAQGLRAQAFLRNPNQRDVATDSRVYRVATGFSGDFGDGWRYNTNFTSSEVDLTRTQNNYLIPQRIMDVVADGSFNFNDPSATDPAVWEYISPENETVSVSRLWLIDANIAKDLWDLGGGTMQAAVGMAYRHESIDAPSGNPANDSAPYTRYYSVNAVGTAGSRDVTSAYFEIDMPFHEMVDVVASGRYDDYSSGQSSFSPKVGFLFEPIDTVGLRGTWSQGFRIPSFNEAFGLPTTGYVNRGIDCTKYADFCAAHGNNAYVTAPYSLGLTQTGDPALDPEESNSFTFGLIWQATPDFNLTVDLWQIEVDGLITGVTNTSEAEDQYYSNNGVVNLPGITVLPGQPDPAFPNALPVIGFVESSYTNQDSQKVSGFDFAANYAVPFGDVKWITALSLSYLAKYELKTDAGDTLAYEGTLSPCNITSCSGAPQWRASWGNTFEIGEKTTATLTTYYTSGLDTASLDFGGVPGDCQFNADNFASTVPLVDGTPYDCKTSAQWNIDLTVLYQWSDRIQLSADVLNVFDIKPKFDPAAAYGLYGFNPAWGGPNIMGRYFRFGVKLDFE